MATQKKEQKKRVLQYGLNEITCLTKSGSTQKIEDMYDIKDINSEFEDLLAIRVTHDGNKYIYLMTEPSSIEKLNRAVVLSKLFLPKKVENVSVHKKIVPSICKRYFDDALIVKNVKNDNKVGTIIPAFDVLYKSDENYKSIYNEIVKVISESEDSNEVNITDKTFSDKHYLLNKEQKSELFFRIKIEAVMLQMLNVLSMIPIENVYVEGKMICTPLNHFEYEIEKL